MNDDMSPNTGCEMTDRLIALADEAWYELLKDKMKEQIQNSCGDKLDKLAEFLSNSNNERWTHMISGKAKCEQFKQDLAQMMVAGATQE